MTTAPKRKPRTPPKNAVTPASFGGPKPRTLPEVTIQEIGRGISMDEVLAIFERAWADPANERGISRSLTLTGKGKGK